MSEFLGPPIIDFGGHRDRDAPAVYLPISSLSSYAAMNNLSEEVMRQITLRERYISVVVVAYAPRSVG